MDEERYKDYGYDERELELADDSVECPHDDAGEGDWCYTCWTNIVTGEKME